MKKNACGHAFDRDNKPRAAPLKRRYPTDRRLLWKKKKTFDLTSRFVMLDMRWKALERLIRMSQVSAQGDAAFLPFSSREVPYIIAQNTS